MREIKFRAWDQHGEMIDEDRFYVASNGVPMWTSNNEQAYDLTVMQYTGLKDKNGTEIYEDDIVHFPYSFVTDWGKVRAGNRAVGECFGCEFMQDEIKGVEVFGNIYENPDHLV